MLGVIASSGSWDLHNYRYIAPAFPLVMIAVGCAFAPIRRSAARTTQVGRTFAIGWAVGAIQPSSEIRRWE